MDELSCGGIFKRMLRGDLPGFSQTDTPAVARTACPDDGDPPIAAVVSSSPL
jgi:hypothetical protein